MEPIPRASFIPKKPIAGSAPGVRSSQGSRQRIGGLFNTLAILLLVAALGVSAGAFGYIRFLEHSLAEKDTTLERMRTSFEPALIQELQRLDTRIESVTALLGRYQAPTKIFDMLERRTLEGVRFSNLAFTAAGSEQVVLVLDGEAQSFAAVALQAEEFKKETLLYDPIFSDFGVNNQGNAVFKVVAVLDPSLLSFERVRADLLRGGGYRNLSPSGPASDEGGEEEGENGEGAPMGEDGRVDSPEDVPFSDEPDDL